MANLLGPFMPSSLGSAIDNLGSCDVKVSGMCCYFNNICDAVASCVSDTNPRSLLDVIGSVPRCVCPKGYTGDGKRNGKGCLNINECEEGLAQCAHNCVDLIPGYRCECDAGYILEQDGRSCSDQNECTGGNHGCSHMCINTPGSYNCSCPQGYRLNGNGRVCDDIDECQEAINHGYSVCPFDELCINEIGSFACGCPKGFTPNNKKCIDNNECVMLGNGSCPNSSFIPEGGRRVQTQLCENIFGSHICTCKSGHRPLYRRGEQFTSLMQVYSKYSDFTEALLGYAVQNNEAGIYKTIFALPQEPRSDIYQMNLKYLKLRKRLTELHNNLLICKPPIIPTKKENTEILEKSHDWFASNGLTDHDIRDEIMRIRKTKETNIASASVPPTMETDLSSDREKHNYDHLESRQRSVYALSSQYKDYEKKKPPVIFPMARSAAGINVYNQDEKMRVESTSSDENRPAGFQDYPKSDADVPSNDNPGKSVNHQHQYSMLINGSRTGTQP